MLTIASTLLILLAPLWLTGFVYLVVGRMVQNFVSDRSVLKIRAWTCTVIFLSFDFASFTVQLVGGAMAPVNAPAERKCKGLYVYMAGIGMQQLSILAFLVFMIKFHVEWRRAEESSLSLDRQSRHAWRLLYSLYVCLGLVTVGRPLYLAR